MNRAPLNPGEPASDVRLPAAADEDDELFGAGDRGVEQVALQHHPGADGQRDHHGGIPRALGAVHGHGVGEFVEVVVDVLALVGTYVRVWTSVDAVTRPRVPLNTPAVPSS